mgnify:CR=1 FL=1
MTAWTAVPELWPLSLAAVGATAAAVTAGLLCFPFILRAGDSRAAPLPGGAGLAAFALGPVAVGFFFAVTGAAAAGVAEAGPRAIGYVVAVLAAAYLLRRGLAALAERLLVSFFVWCAILVAPAFLRDPVNHAAVGALLNTYRFIGVLG